jgi:hypothetical protein
MCENYRLFRDAGNGLPLSERSMPSRSRDSGGPRIQRRLRIEADPWRGKGYRDEQAVAYGMAAVFAAVRSRLPGRAGVIAFFNRLSGRWFIRSVFRASLYRPSPSPICTGPVLAWNMLAAGGRDYPRLLAARSSPPARSASSPRAAYLILWPTGIDGSSGAVLLVPPENAPDRSRET